MRNLYKVIKQSKRTKAADTPWVTVRDGLEGLAADQLCAQLAREQPSYRFGVVVDTGEGQ